MKQQGSFQERRQAVDAFNAGSRYRKRGLALIPTKFGIAFTAFFLNQVQDGKPHCAPAESFLSWSWVMPEVV